MQCSTPYAFATSTCLALNNFRPWDEVPIRSPLVTADALLPEVRGRDIVEIGSRNGDVFDCLSRFAKRAWAVEMDPKYCNSLRARGFEVACGKLTETSVLQLLPIADVYFMWMFHKYAPCHCCVHAQNTSPAWANELSTVPP